MLKKEEEDEGGEERIVYIRFFFSWRETRVGRCVYVVTWDHDIKFIEFPASFEVSSNFHSFLAPPLVKLYMD